MAIWFEGTSDIESSIEQVQRYLDDHGELFVGIVRLIPGMSMVEIVDQGSDYVTIRTNEGLMQRTNITKQVGPSRVVLEFDEQYDAGSKVTATSHFVHQFTPSNSGATHSLVMSDLEAPGILGFFYRTFGARKMGNAFLKAYQEYFAHQRN